MKFDEQTINDLNILPNQSNESSMFSMFNNVKTVGARRKLKAIFETPLDNLSEINLRQKSLKYLVNNIEKWNIRFGVRLIKSVERYLRLQIIPITTRNYVKLNFIRLKYKENYFDQQQGVINLYNFLKRLEKIVKAYNSDHLPKLLKDIFLSFITFLENDSIKPLLKVKNENEFKTQTIYIFDNFIRNNLIESTKDILDKFYDLEVLISLASTIKTNNYNFPTFVNSKNPIFNAEELYHPFLENPQKYSFSLSKSNSFLFLTGPNMAGKTTFLKACGLAVYLAHIGLGVPTKHLKLTLYSNLICGINTEDNLKLGYSYFFSEVKRVKAVAEVITSEKSVFVILDELFKGTNVHDAYEASQKVISSIAKWDNCIFLLSSHLIEIVNTPEIKKILNCMYFDAKIENGTPIFTYKLKKGVSKLRLGMKILEKENIIKILEK